MRFDPTARKRARDRFAARSGPLLALAGILLVCLAWAIASPVFAYPDEGAHVTRAAAVVDGQVVAPDKPLSKEGWPIIRAPNSLAQSIYRSRCLWSGYGHPNIPASCSKPLPPYRRMTQVRNAAGRYEPAYYAVVGWPLRWAPTANGVYAARAVNAVVCALLLGVALLAMGSRGRRWWQLAVLTALTPYVLYTGGGINPSAWEICAAVATWAGVLRLCADDLVRKGLVAATAVAAAVLGISRPLGPLWLVLIAAVAGAATPWAKVRALVSTRAIQVALAVTGVSCVASLMWTVTQTNASFDTQPLRHPLPFGDAFGQSFDRLPHRLEEMVAVFGWLDVPVPWITVAVWIALTALLVGAALWRGAGRARWTLLGLAVLTVLVPALVEAHMATRIGMVWQGRYTLPLAVGVPLLAGQILQARSTAISPPRWMLPVAASLAGIAQVTAFIWALRRYEHGVPGSLNPFTGAWLPPGGPVLVIALFMVGIAALCAGLAMTSPGWPASDGPESGPIKDEPSVEPLWAGAGSNRRPSAFQADARTD